MTCEGCGKEIGDIKSLRAHRKTCAKYEKWNAPFVQRAYVEPPEHKYDGRTVPRIFG